MRFKIVIPAYNSLPWLQHTLESVAQQRARNFDVCVVDDASMLAGQCHLISRFCEEHSWQAIFHKENRGALSGIIGGIERLAPDDEDVIVLIDGDDWLFDSSVLGKLDAIYHGPERVTLTYGQYLGSVQGNLGCSAPISPRDVEARRFRELPWQFSHLRTFRHLLWRRVDDADLRDEQGDYFRVAWDLAMMFPMLEMAGHTIRYVHDILYVYNQANPLNDHKLRPDEQKRTAEVIRRRPRYPRVLEERCRNNRTTFATRCWTAYLQKGAAWGLRSLHSTAPARAGDA